MLLAAAQPPLHPSGAEPPAGYCWPGKAAVPRGAELPSPAAVTDVRQAEHRFPIALRPPARLKLGVRTDHRKLPESGTDIQKGTRRMKGGLVASWLKLTSGSFQKPGEKKENSVLPRLESPPSALRRPGSIPWRERRSCLGYYPERAAGNCWLKHRTVGSSDARSGPFVVCLRFRTSCARKKREITSSARASPHSSGTSNPPRVTRARRPSTERSRSGAKRPSDTCAPSSEVRPVQAGATGSQPGTSLPSMCFLRRIELHATISHFRFQISE